MDLETVFDEVSRKFAASPYEKSLQADLKVFRRSLRNDSIKHIAFYIGFGDAEFIAAQYQILVVVRQPGFLVGGDNGGDSRISICGQEPDDDGLRLHRKLKLDGFSSNAHIFGNDSLAIDLTQTDTTGNIVVSIQGHSTKIPCQFLCTR